ncbi:MAG: choice-of-anchor D domain-containing protein [Acidobacteria bacterium]|nr:choice-of-anchor D domain-containing protein [Acidobacteriota bacterium]
MTQLPMNSRFRASRHGFRLGVALLTLASLVSGVVGAAHAGADSYQISNDNSSTGWYPNQPLLTPSSVGGSSFGSLFDATLSGKIYAQPLVDKGQVLAVTENDWAYGVNAATGAISWSNNYGPAATPTGDIYSQTFNSCGDLGTSIGITGTPVIDPATNTAYFVAARASGPDRIWNKVDYGPSTQYYLEAANVTTGAPPAGWPSAGVLISGAANNDPTTSFVPDYQTQRPGLVLVNGVVYAAFSAQCDYLPPTGTYAGWLIGISTATHSVTTLWASETNASDGGGIWQSGGAPVVDSSGNIYVITGNSISSGIAPPVGSNGFSTLADYGEAVVKLSTSSGTLTPVDWFVPAGVAALDTQDLDFSSGGPVALPASMGTPQEPNVLLGVGKNAILYSMDMSNLGGYEHGGNGGDAVPSELAVSGGVWGRPAVWPGDGGYIYLPTTGSAGQQSTGTFNAYQRVVSTSGAVGFQPVGTAASFGYTSGSPVVTSNGTESGSSLVWVIQSSGDTGAGGQLDAFDPIPQNPGPNGTLTKVWSSSTFTAEKFSSPGVGNGSIYVGTGDGHLLGFGFTSATPPVTGPNVDFAPTIISQSTTGTATFTASPGTTTTTISGFSIHGSAYSKGSPSVALPATLQPGQSISVPVTFTPTVTGANPGTLSANFSHGSNNGVTTVTLSGTGVAATSQVVASPTTVDFGLQPESGPLVSLPVTMTNKTSSTINITGFTAPLSSSPFSITRTPSTGPLASGASLTFTVNFAPPGTSANFSHVFGDVATLETSIGNFGIPLSGSAAPPAVLALLPTSLNFSNVPVGQSATLTFAVKDNGGFPLTITKSAPPTLGKGFTATSTLAANTVLAANSSVQETVRFAPTSAGSVSDSWVISSNDGNPPATLVIQGTGVVTKPNAPTIGTASAGDHQATVTWTAPSNNGGATISDFTATATDSTTSANGGQTCTASGASSTQCVVTGLTNGDSYTFTATATNSVGTSVPSAASNAVVPLVATPPPVTPPAVTPPAVTPSQGQLLLSPVSLAFGDVGVGQSRTLSFEIENTGNVPLKIVAMSPPSGNSFEVTTSLVVNSVIAAGGSVSGVAQFNPTSTGVTNATWAITSDAGDGATTLVLSGTGMVNKPDAPLIGTASVSFNTATVNWRAPVSDGGSSIVGYRAIAKDLSDPLHGGQTCLVGGGATQCIVSGLSNGDRYTFSVVATNQAGDGPSSGPSNVVRMSTLRSPTLSITTRKGRAGSPLDLKTRGDSLGGLLHFLTVDGTASGCRIRSNVLRSTTGGTCVVVAYRVGHRAVAATLSPAIAIVMSGRPLGAGRISLTVAFSADSSTLSLRTRAMLTALAESLRKGATVTIIGYGRHSQALAEARARSVARYLSHLKVAHLVMKTVTSSGANIAEISSPGPRLRLNSPGRRGTASMYSGTSRRASS